MFQYLWLTALIFEYGGIYANPHLDGRIIGGIPVNISSAPYQVSLQVGQEHICGGSIIHHSYILTAAHCIEGESIKKLKIRAGSHLHNQGGLVRPVCSVIKHRNYSDDTYDYDIAIVKLCDNLIFNQRILPIALPEYNENLKDGTSGLVSGWGFTNENVNVFSPLLLKVSLVSINQASCRKTYKPLGPVTPRMLCAGCKIKGACDSCQGDSGGPLVANGKLMGVVSWGYGCAHKEFPGVYTRVSKLRLWIKSKVGV